MITWLDLFKEKTIDVSEEVKNLFNNVIPNLNKNEQKALQSIGGIDDLIKKNKIADESFKEWAKNITKEEFTFENYQQYLKDTNQGITAFATLTQNAGTVLKGFGAALASMAVNWAIGELIGLAINGIQYLTDANDRYIESQQNIIDTASENIQKYDEEIISLESLQKQLIATGGNKVELAKLTGELNTVIGETPGLLTDEGQAYEIANKKIRDRITQLVGTDNHTIPCWKI